MFGALSCIVFGDMLGRRRTIFLASLVTIIGAVLMSSSFSLAQMIVARLVLGLGTGGTTATVPVWQAEISRATHRGAHVVSEGIFVGVGIAVALWVDFALYFVHGNSVAWRFPLALQIIFSLTVMAFIFSLPESPRWLLKRDRVDEAREILGILEETGPHSATVSRDVEDIQRSLAIAGSGSRWDLLRMGKERMLNRTWLAATLQLFQQMCGIVSLSIPNAKSTVNCWLTVWFRI
jgi:MFS family permease